MNEDILEPLERKLNESVSALEKMQDLYTGENPSKIASAIKMLKNALLLLRNTEDFSTYAYLCSELREMLKQLFGEEKEEFRIKDLSSTFELKECEGEIPDHLVRSVEKLGIGKLKKFTKRTVSCQGKLSKVEVEKLRSLSDNKTFLKLINGITNLAGPAIFNPLCIRSNLEYWGPIFGIPEEKIFQKVRGIKIAYSGFSGFAHIQAESQHISELLYFYNNSLLDGDDTDAIRSREELKSFCEKILPLLDVLDDFKHLPSEKYDIIDELITNE